MPTPGPATAAAPPPPSPTASTQLTSIGGSATTHDARGNLTYDPTTGATFTYWSDNRLRVAYGGVPWSSFGYDALGRLEGMEVPPAVTRFA